MKLNQMNLPSLKEAQKRTKERSIIERSLFEIPESVKGIGKNRFYYLRTYGCQANERDGETLAGIFEQLEFTQTTDVEKADVILLNTCAIRQNAEDKVFGELGALKRLKRRNPDLIIGLCGCMAQEEEVIEKVLASYPQVDLIFGTHNIHRLPQLLYQAMLSKERTFEIYSKEGEVIENLPAKRFGNHKAWVNIMYGCDKFCTYCIVPYTRGKERSREISDILQEVKELKEQGYQEVTLLGQNVNAYGKDLGYENGFSKLLAEVALIDIPRIRFTTSHPWDFTGELIDIIAKYDNIMPALHLPVQSGNNDILKIMGRRYTVESYKEIFDALKKKIPHCSFSTDVIVGFPNETEEQFQQTLDLYDYCQFDLAYTFIYSPREGTPAAKMNDNVSEEEKKDRLKRLNQLVSKYSLMKNKEYVGKVVSVLVDGPSKRNPEVYSGYTDTNKLVNFIPTTAKTGEIVTVEITDVKTWSMNGKQC